MRQTFWRPKADGKASKSLIVCAQTIAPDQVEDKLFGIIG